MGDGRGVLAAAALPGAGGARGCGLQVGAGQPQALDPQVPEVHRPLHGDVRPNTAVALLLTPTPLRLLDLV